MSTSADVCVDTALRETFPTTTGITKGRKIQSCWGGYGEIRRYTVHQEGAPINVVAKHVTLPPGAMTTDDPSLQRKFKSYQVEMCWYSLAPNYHLPKLPHCFGAFTNMPTLAPASSASPSTSRATSTPGRGIPDILITEVSPSWIFLLEDLDHQGFSVRKLEFPVDFASVCLCLRWLAEFHAAFLYDREQEETSPALRVKGELSHTDNVHSAPVTAGDMGLWPVGTYWHIGTRLEELKRMETTHPLHDAAHKIDHRLSDARFLTVVHGDAKLANFCFADDDTSVAAVDFQYIGGGCGMKDVVYFLGSAIEEEHYQRCIDVYFQELRDALQNEKSHVDVASLELEWRTLFPFAFADFHRFLLGWSPQHWKINDYSESLSRRLVSELGSG